jgi:dolichol-phosphate mannosyltransferase
MQRVGRQGLATACIEGALATSASYIAIMDADMQHDEKLLPQVLAILKSEPVDMVVGSRHVAGGGIGQWDAAVRRWAPSPRGSPGSSANRRSPIR